MPGVSHTGRRTPRTPSAGCRPRRKRAPRWGSSRPNRTRPRSHRAPPSGCRTSVVSASQRSDRHSGTRSSSPASIACFDPVHLLFVSRLPSSSCGSSAASRSSVSVRRFTAAAAARSSLDAGRHHVAYEELIACPRASSLSTAEGLCPCASARRLRRPCLPQSPRRAAIIFCGASVARTIGGNSPTRGTARIASTNAADVGESGLPWVTPRRLHGRLVTHPDAETKAAAAHLVDERRRFARNRPGCGCRSA